MRQAIRALVLALVMSVMWAATLSAQTVRVVADRTNLREKPSATSGLVATIVKGTQLDVLEVVQGWYRVRTKDGVEGYVNIMVVEVVSGTKPAPRTPERPAPAAGQPAQKPPVQVQPSPTAGKGAVPGGAAQPKPAPPATRPAPPKPRLSVRGIVDFSGVWMSAANSFTAVTGGSSRVQYGGGVQVINLWQRIYAEVTVGWSSLSGSRVFVDDGTVYDMGIPTSITFTPVEAGGGWRFPVGKTLHVYAGAGMTIMGYMEESDFASGEDDVSTSAGGFYVSGGVEYRLMKWVHLRGEVRYTSLPGAMGTAGVSAGFKETDLGGAAVAVKIAIGK